MRKIAVAESDDEITKCLSVMRDLRPHLQANDFLRRVKNLAETTGFRLAFLLDGGEAVSDTHLTLPANREGKQIFITIRSHR